MSEIRDKAIYSIAKIADATFGSLLTSEGYSEYDRAEKLTQLAEDLLSIPEIKKGLLLYEAAEKGEVAIVDRMARLQEEDLVAIHKSYSAAEHNLIMAGAKAQADKMLKAGWRKVINE